MFHELSSCYVIFCNFHFIREEKEKIEYFLLFSTIEKEAEK
ncbi:hypothetical protein BB65665_11140 [Bacillus sp. 916]|nr:hypothetical protein BAMY6639_12760 [Bacillus amyloliquefaciens UMAF6639]EJD67476.1 hypothetical protein BB65665_11140 [Bacillus sp. 916]KYC87403.1 hypothetical protein B4140_0533 [Bacillus amyloliquefaciens]RAP11671.1 hypothetical protein HS9_03279 [Bacillus velezensis]